MVKYVKRIASVGSGNCIYFGNLKVCLMKGLIPILHLITILLQNYVVMVLKQE